MIIEENILFADRYRLIRQLGRGGFSEVWLAEDIKTGVKVAVKIYAPGMGLDDDGVQLFSQEFSLVFNLNHSNLLKPTYYDIHDRMPYLVMPFCELGSSVKLIGRITEEEAWRFLRDVAAGLAYLHASEPPVIHQDIKPDNILIDGNGRFQITDFGISTKARSTLRKSALNMQSSGGGGTLCYMGPERFSKESTPVKASDIWSLGATLFELMMGYPPFGDHGGLLLKSGAEIPDITGAWSSNLKNVVYRCLAKEPWDRPTAETVHGWADKYLSGQSIKFETNKKNKYFKPIIAAVAICIVVLGIILFSLGSRPDTVARQQECLTLIEQADRLVGQGEQFYKEAMDGYQKATKIVDKYNLTSMNSVFDKKNSLAYKIDSLILEYENLAEFFSELDSKEGNEQAEYFRKSAAELKNINK